MSEEWLEQILICSEAVFIVDDAEKEIVYANNYAKKWTESRLIGEKCYRAIMGCSKTCALCPDEDSYINIDSDGFYAWDCYCGKKSEWVKIKTRKINKDGKDYLVININAIDDTMSLNTDTVKEMAFQKRLLEENLRMRTALEHDATHDKLTGLFNKTKYLDDMNTLYRDIDSVGVVFFDVNHLKVVNDTLGHDMGDKMIAKMGSAMIRQQSEQIRCYRFGGDEFVAVCMNSNPELIEHFIDKVQTRLDKLNIEDPEPICRTAVGYAYSKDVITDIDLLVKEADDRMYEDKKRKKAERKD